jgi:hypothetical protein
MDDRAFLDQLARTLATPGMPTQAALANAVGVDQPLVSRAKKGKLLRVTPRVAKLAEYASMRAKQMSPQKTATGESAPLTALREKYPPTSRLGEKVLDECRAYLSEGCDPVVLRDQIALLRRAQKGRTAGTG